MQITKKQLKQIITEEIEDISDKERKTQELMENYISEYSTEEDYVSKQALIDLLEVLEETKIPKEAFEMFVEYLPENSVNSILEEVSKEE